MELLYEDELVAHDPHPLTQYVQRLVQRVRAVDERRPLLWDLLVTGFFVTAGVIDFAGGGWRNVAPDQDVPGPLVLAMSLGLTLPLLWRRRHPMGTLAVMVAFGTVSSGTGAMLQAALVQLIVLFSVALRLPLRTLGWAGAMMLVPLLVGTVRYPRGSWDQQIVPQVWAYAIVALLGIAVRSRQDHTQALVERARRLEVERDQQAQLAAAAERTRIAREMHDIIGHNLSVITGLADGGKYAAAKSPEHAAQALDAIGSTSRQALAELRRLLDVLRDDAPEAAALAPQPALADLTRLIDGVRSAGLPVRTTVHGRPDALPQGQELTVYRVVQEALTNTLKHGGPGATAAVRITYADDGVTVTVTDTGTAARTAAAPDGRGLTGMRERTALYAGTLEAGPRPRPATGWEVRLHLPRTTADDSASSAVSASASASAVSALVASPKESAQ
ncbi:Sensor histidine kinase DesK [Streptomyces sp. YIM 121038]|uniref:sensor histidine kinase n=1 Tax=Streptomyces sp. YIM 121038 TaxID=2136401 RepID=UPI0011101BE8|nr:histidine kinase [Streptomyces sp. YIM 121038]QCX77547.1 Sensor histidine kinase DesK [Streptomyces sp. YIM 121038]